MRADEEPAGNESIAGDAASAIVSNVSNVRVDVVVDEGTGSRPAADAVFSVVRPVFAARWGGDAVPVAEARLPCLSKHEQQLIAANAHFEV